MDIKKYYDSKEVYSVDHFKWKTTEYKANQSIAKSFDWIDFADKNVLDIGCGVGYYSIPISKKCKYVTGIDISEHNIDIASKYSSFFGIQNVKFSTNNFFTYNPKELFDVVTLITVLMHIPDVDSAIKKINSFLKPGGLLLISDINKWFPTRMINHKNSSPIFIQSFSFRQLNEVLKNNGFLVVKESGRLFSFGGLRKPDWVVFTWMEKFGHIWPIKYFGEHISILARKLN